MGEGTYAVLLRGPHDVVVDEAVVAEEGELRKRRGHREKGQERCSLRAFNGEIRSQTASLVA